MAEDPLAVAAPLQSEAPPVQASPTPAAPEDPSTRELMGAAFRQENWLVNAYEYLTREDYGPEDPTHNPYDTIKGTVFEEYGVLEPFVNSRNEKETRAIMARILKEDSDREMLAKEGWAGVAAQIGAGLVDPLVFIPGLGVARGATGAVRIGKSAARIGAIAGAQTALAEGVMQTAQESRQVGDSALAIAGSTVIGGILGAGAAGLTRRQLAKLGAQLEADMADEAPELLEPVTRKLIVDPEPEPHDLATRPASGGAAASPYTAAGDSTPIAERANRAAAAIRLSPFNGLQASPFEASQRFVRDLGEAAAPVRANQQGIPMTEGGAVETWIKQDEYRMLRDLNEVYNAYAKYRFGQDDSNTLQKALVNPARAYVQRNDGKMKYAEFVEEVTKAARKAEPSPVPEVARAVQAYRQFTERMKKEAIDNGIFSEDVKVLGAEKYVSRLWDGEKIVANRGRLKNILNQHFVRQRDARLRNKAKLEEIARQDVDFAASPEATQEEVLAALDRVGKKIKSGKVQDPATIQAINSIREGLEDFFDGTKPLSAVLKKEDPLVDMSDQEVGSLVDETINNLLGYNRQMNPAVSVVQGVRGPLKARVLNVPDALVEDFLDNNIETIMRTTNRSMSGDLALIRKFGDVTMERKMKELTDEFTAKMDQTKSAKEREALTKWYEGDRRRIEALRDRVRGTYGMPRDPNQILTRAGRSLLSLQYMAKLGGMTLSAIPDIAYPVMRFGPARVLGDGWGKKFFDKEAVNYLKNNSELLRPGLELALDHRAMELANMFDAQGSKSRLGKAIEGGASRFGLVSLMSPWNETMKQIVAMTSTRWHLDAMEKLVAGKASKNEITKLAENNINLATAERVLKAMKETPGGGDQINGKWYPNTDAWEDRRLADVLGQAIIKDTDRAIVTPGLELNLFAKEPIGRVMLQFKSFTLSATQRIAMSNLSYADKQVASGIVSAIALGGLAAGLKQIMRGKDPSEWTEEQWVHEAVDASGILGILGEGLNMMDKVGAGPALLTGKPVSRYASRNIAGTIAGPTGDTLQDAVSVLTSITGLEGDRFDEKDIARIRKIIPLQNVFYLRKIFDLIEEGIVDATVEKK